MFIKVVQGLSQSKEWIDRVIESSSWDKDFISKWIEYVLKSLNIKHESTVNTFEIPS